VRIKWKVLRLIEKHMDEWVELAEKCVEDTEVAGGNMEESQLRNLQNLAAATDSLKVLENFVCYQMGRYPRAWTEKFGEQLLADFKKLEGRAAELCDQAGERDAAAIRRVRADLIRLYLGFLVRRFVSLKER